MTADDIQVRRDICEGCKLACEVRETIDHTSPCAECPLRVWHAWGDCDTIVAPEKTASLSGLGDVVAMVAQPIARTIDVITRHRTNVAGCGGCKKRREALNRAVPFTRQPDAADR